MKNNQVDEEYSRAVLINNVQFALFQIPPEKWGMLSISPFTYTLVDGHEPIQAMRARVEGREFIFYRKNKEDAYKVDIYQTYQFDSIRELYRKEARLKRKPSKKAHIEALEKAIQKELTFVDKLLPDGNIFFSRDLTNDLSCIKGMKEVKDSPTEEDNLDAIAAAPMFEYKKHVLFSVGKCMMDDDYTPKDMYALIPMFSFVARKEDESGERNKIYDLMNWVRAETVISTAEGWASEAIDNGMCGSPQEHANEGEQNDPFGFLDEKPSGIPMDSTPVKVVDDYSWGETENGEYNFTESQLDGIDEELKMALASTSPSEWNTIFPSDDNFKELKGLDYNIGTKKCSVFYTISCMNDIDGRFFVFSTFNADKKLSGRVIKEDDFANYMLCKLRMNIVMTMIMAIQEMERHRHPTDESQGTAGKRKRTSGGKNQRSTRRKRKS